MAISNTPPPQAYTREVLAQAFNWLKSQPATVRERALSADALVGLYLHAKRYGGSPAVSPWEQDSEAGANAFKSDLKSLARGFKEFEIQTMDAPSVPVQMPLIIPPPSQPLVQSDLQPQPQPETQTPTPTPPPAPAPAAPPQATSTSTMAQSQSVATTQTQTVQQTVTTTQVQAHSVVNSFVQELDPKTLDILREVQSRLNLSSEQEALRMLVLLGSEKIRTLLPP